MKQNRMRPEGLGWSITDITNPEMKMATAMVDMMSHTYEQAAEVIRDAPDPVIAAGRMAGQIFRSYLMRSNSQGQAVPKNVSRAAVMLMVSDLLQAGEEAGIIKPESPEQRAQTFMAAINEAAKVYTKQQLGARKNVQDQHEMANATPQGPEGEPQEPMPEQPMPEQQGLVGMAR